jgi:glycine oxidase
VRVAIIGGGIIGLSIALELRSAGVETVVFDKSPHGTQTSLAAGGMLAPQKEAHAPGAFLDLCLRSRTIWPKFAGKIAGLSGQKSTYLESGILTSAFTDDEVHSLDATAAWQRACSLRIELITGDEARKQEPALSDRVQAAAWFPDEHQIDPVAFVPALVEACRRSGVRLVTADVQQISQEAGRATGVVHAAGAEAADVVVLAAGAWSSRIAGACVAPDLVEPVRGQMIELHGVPMPSRILGGPRCYIIPRGDGRAVAGTTEERVGFDLSTTHEGVDRIVAAVRELCPSLAEATLTKRWAGLRPLSSGELPVLGKGPLENLVLATGHFRNGVLLAPLTARVVSQLIHGQRTSVDLKPFRYDRLPS